MAFMENLDSDSSQIKQITYVLVFYKAIQLYFPTDVKCEFHISNLASQNTGEVQLVFCPNISKVNLKNGFFG